MLTTFCIYLVKNSTDSLKFLAISLTVKNNWLDVVHLATWRWYMCDTSCYKLTVFEVYRNILIVTVPRTGKENVIIFFFCFKDVSKCYYHASEILSDAPNNCSVSTGCFHWYRKLFRNMMKIEIVLNNFVHGTCATRRFPLPTNVIQYFEANFC